MSKENLLLNLYDLEKPILQRNEWFSLRVPVDLLAQKYLDDHPGEQPTTFEAALRALRLDGKVMLLPPWEELGKSMPPGTTCDSNCQWELTDLANLEDQATPSWQRRKVFLPDSLKGWFVRSRMAELTRLLAWNRERFGLAPSSAHIGYELQARFRPQRVTGGISQAVAHLTNRAGRGHFSRATDTNQLMLAIEIVGKGLERSLGCDALAGFQERTWKSVLDILFNPGAKYRATMITAGVSSGKTYSFALPIMTAVVYHALLNHRGVIRALVVYPRTSLVEDQYHTFLRLIAGINEELMSRGLEEITANPALDAGQMLGASIGVKNQSSLSVVLPEVSRRRTEIILTTSESLKNRMIDCRALRPYFSNVDIVVFDEIHLMEGLSGCQGIYLIRRLRQLLRTLRTNDQFEPAWVGASATVAEPVEHCARAMSLPITQVQHISPESQELERFGTFHHIFVHTRQGKSAISAVTNGLCCTAHNRNDSTAHSHYLDPSVTHLRPRPGAEIPKTITFVDSLSTIGRLRFTTADNEKTYDPFSSATPPYYAWFYRPAARLRATRTERGSIERAAGTGSLAAIRDWCSKCYHGEPAVIGKAVLQTTEYNFLRNLVQMDQAAIERATPPGLPERLAQLPDLVGNLNRCPFLIEGVCWWWSQDPGTRLEVDTGRLFMDQNRAIAYTSRTQDGEGALHEDVNDYFLIPSEQLWERANIRGQQVSTSTLIASPRIEVGVDFRNVRDGVTHKALRSASSFQQKVGRVGREDGSDSVIVTFLAHRTTDAHFAHHPARLIDAQHLDPIPLKAENPDVIKSALFASALDYIATRPKDTIPNSGERLNIIGTGSSAELPWTEKLQSVLDYLVSNRSHVCNYMTSAVGNHSMVDANVALDTLLEILRVLTLDLKGAFHNTGSAAHWIYSNTEPAAVPAFALLLQQMEKFRADARRFSSYAEVYATMMKILEEIEKQSPSVLELQKASNTLQQNVNIVDSSLTPDLYQIMGTVYAIKNSLGQLNLAGNFSDIRFGYDLVTAFKQYGAPATRVMKLHYFHSLLTTLWPFRRFYPFGLSRTQFQHINAKNVTVILSRDGIRDDESIDTALYELLPGSWNYRWLKPKKSPSGDIEVLGGSNAHYVTLENLEVNGAVFEPTGAELTAADVPSEMPQFGPSDALPVYRPRVLPMRGSHYRPTIDWTTHLVADGDESPVTTDPNSLKCPTLPRAFPVTWYRVSGCAQRFAVRSPGDSSIGVGIHEYPALGRWAFDEVIYSTDMKTDTFVYALDRTYGVGTIESPRLYYRKGSPHQWAALGDQASQTDGLIFRLNDTSISTATKQAVQTACFLRGELLIRTLRRFLLRETGADPFQADMLRKVILAQVLDASNRTLSTMDTADIQKALLAIDRQRFDMLRDRIIDGLVAGTSGIERTLLQNRYVEWYERAYSLIDSAQNAAPRFDLALLQDTTTDILIHSLSVLIEGALTSLVGASNNDMGYFYSPSRQEVYIFDKVEGGNGYSETAQRFLHIPPLQRLLHARDNTRHSLPDVDGFQLLDEAIGDCPGQLATRVLFEAVRLGVTDVSNLSFHSSVSADLQARVRHEFNSISGSAFVLTTLARNWSNLFASWQDLLWVQVFPEWFTSSLVSSGVVSGIEELRTRTHLCVSGCIECVDNGESSVHGTLSSAEHVSRGMLDVFRANAKINEQASYLDIPAWQSIGATLQQGIGQPVLDENGDPITVQIVEDGTTRQILLTKVLSTVSSAHGVSLAATMLRQVAPGRFEVGIPFVAAYRDERPLQ